MDNNDIQEFLSKISEAEFKTLGDLIMGNNKMKSLQLSCQLVSRHFPHIPDLACQHYGSYIHDMLQQSVKHYFMNKNSLFGGGNQFTYQINDFIDNGPSDNLNIMYEIVQDTVDVIISINSTYNILVLNEDSDILLFPEATFIGEDSDEDHIYGLKFIINGDEKIFELNYFSIMNPDNADDLNLGHLDLLIDENSDNNKDNEDYLDSENGNPQYMYEINHFWDFGVQSNNLNEIYEITEDLVNMKLTINSEYIVLEDDNAEGEIYMHLNSKFLGEIYHNDDIISLKFLIDNEEKTFNFGYFSIMNPDNVDEMVVSDEDSDYDLEDIGDDLEDSNNETDSDSDL